MTDQELKKLVASLAIESKKTDKQLKKTDEKLNKIAKLVGSIGNNQGDVAEEYFVNSLSKNPKILKKTFDKILPNLEGRSKEVKDEYDIVLLNGESIAIIKVKYKVHPKDVDKLDKKIETFKKLFPEYKHLKLYAGVAGFKVVKDVFEKGYFVLQRNGDVIETFVGELKAA